MKKGFLPKIVVLVVIGVAFYLIKHYGLQEYFTLNYVKANQESFANYYLQNQMQTLAIYFGIYILVTALSVPGAATIMTLLAGGLFGLKIGLILVSFASTIGATLAFLIVRFLFKDFVQEKFASKLKSINEGVEKEGAFYLLSLRMIPIFPFFLINIGMALTPIRAFTFFFISQLGMLAGTAVYVNAGKELAQLDSLSGILSPGMLLSFALLGIFPVLAKKFISYLQGRKVYKNYKRPKKYDYNMVVIGAGAGGLVTSYISAAVKAKVALIEKHKMGGDCLNTGCVPSKALIKTAKVVNFGKKAAEFGIDKIDISFDFAKVMDRVQNVITKVEPHDSIERYTELGVECITGEAQIISPWEVKVGDRVLTTKNITIATGARPFVPKIKGIEQVDILVSDNLWDIRELPQRLVVLGGGPIGCEIAQSFARLGSEVIQIERNDRLLKIEDPSVSKVLESAMSKDGVKVLTSHETVEFSDSNTLVCSNKGNKVEVKFDKILIAVGRAANVKGFGLEDLEVEIRDNGTIQVNDFLQTNYPNIYACGDVTGPYQLTHMAAHQAWFAAVNGLFGKFKKFKVDYSVVPWCTYTEPEIATVGLNEVFAEKMGMKVDVDYEITEYGIDDLDRAIAEGEDYGFVKILTVPGKDKILGATIISTNASNMILEFVSAMKNGFGLNAILGTIHIYPSMGEANKYAAGVWKKAHAPENLLGYVEKFHKWMRS